MINKLELPELSYNDWTETRTTLHLILQIIGKSRLKSTHRKNHWWYMTIYVSPKGFSTHAIPVDDGLSSFQVVFNLHKKTVILSHSRGDEIILALDDQMSVANFYKQYMSTLNAWGLYPEFIEKPLDMNINKRFDELTEFHHYEWQYLHRFWEMMRWNNDVFQEFSGRFYGKTCPVHIYWHHLDLTVTRFSGKRLEPVDANARILEKDSYSHEQISFGFWVGDDNLQEPAYYAYAHPSPANLDQAELSPTEAFWMDANGSPMGILKYNDIRNSDNPRAAVLSFLESVYQAAAKGQGWNITELTVPSLSEL